MSKTTVYDLIGKEVVVFVAPLTLWGTLEQRVGSNGYILWAGDNILIRFLGREIKKIEGNEITLER